MNKVIYCFLIIILGCSSSKNSKLAFRENDFVKVNKLYGINNRYPIFSPLKFHNGLTVQLEKDSPIYALFSGQVIEVCNLCTRSFGKYILIRHLDDFVIRYYHLDKINVNVGDIITKGKRIGIAGQSGLITEFGLGIQVKVNDSFVNPNLYLSLPLQID